MLSSLSKGQFFIAYLFVSFNIPSNSTFKQRKTQDLLLQNDKVRHTDMELELDDDVFFADISKQISLLIMDEDEHLNHVSLSSPYCPSLSVQGMFRGGYETAPYMYHQEQSKGTGVFIPKCYQSRRRPRHPKQGRFSSFNAKQQHSFRQNKQQYQQNHEKLRSNLTSHTNNNNKSSMITGNVHASFPRRAYRDAASIYA